MKLEINFQYFSKKINGLVIFFSSDTTGEKSEEEFYTTDEKIDLNKFNKIGIIKNEEGTKKEKLIKFLEKINKFKLNKNWTRQEILESFNQILENFDHLEEGKFLDDKM